MKTAVFLLLFSTACRAQTCAPASAGDGKSSPVVAFFDGCGPDLFPVLTLDDGVVAYVTHGQLHIGARSHGKEFNRSRVVCGTTLRVGFAVESRIEGQSQDQFIDCHTEPGDYVRAIVDSDLRIYMTHEFGPDSRWWHISRRGRTK